jgi:hypothetical protein
VAKKVYFACAIRGGGDTSTYEALLHTIKAAGGDILSEIFVNDAILYGGSPLPEAAIYQRDIGMIHEADVIIAEVTNPSLGVGYELGYAEAHTLPVICLFNTASGRKLSAMISGNPYNKVVEYTPDQLPEEAIAAFLK